VGNKKNLCVLTVRNKQNLLWAHPTSWKMDHDLFSGLKWPAHEDNYLSSFSVMFKNTWTYTSTYPYVCSPSARYNFIFTTGCSKSHDTHGKMRYKFDFFIIMPFSYNKCWKCQSLRSSQSCTRRIMLANTFCNVPVDILSTVRWMFAWRSCSVCGWFEYTVSLRFPIQRSLRGLSPGIVEATISLKWGVQETQIPSKPWVAWLF
jgi:hypothetical protein